MLLKSSTHVQFCTLASRFYDTADVPCNDSRVTRGLITCGRALLDKTDQYKINIWDSSLSLSKLQQEVWDRSGCTLACVQGEGLSCHCQGSGTYALLSATVTKMVRINKQYKGIYEIFE